ncbi:Tiny macrocysts protein B [Tetrabaena socialis]|uniref:Tiny macrocysts protein B n=1 Tax=Tetrabaena socialis TaxID=47790 RepID=A0A2J7ZTR1_9CHLO|nr:Tiny macrocysts protein B [Tetrabaena socialis]|eukprot:PNH03659.1 Tiny macrocysts protein B [Tetrabaena socialis]
MLHSPSRPLGGLAPGKDDRFEDPHTLQQGLFGVLYTVSKEKKLSSVSFAFFRMFLDFLQLWLLVVNPSYGWVIGAKTKVWQVVSFIQLNDFLGARGYTTFLVLLYVFVGLLAVNLVISVWVAHSFSNNRFEFVWPIQFLRWFGLIFYQVLDIATLTLLLVTLDCNYFNVPASIRFHNQEFPDVMCWSMPHIAHVGVSVASIVVFYIMATSMVVSEVEVGGMKSRALMVVATVASVMVSSSVKWLAIVYLACFAVLFYLHAKWVPFIYSTLNYVRCGSYATVLYCSILLVAMAFGPSGDSAHSHQKIVTLAMWIGMAPAAIVGAVVCHLRLRHFDRYVLGRFRDAEPDMKPKFIYRFEDAREVEIAARCCRCWIDEDMPDPEAVAMSEQVIKAGMILLPQDPYMVILYSSFLIDVQGSYQSGYTQLQTAKKQSPGLLERFAIFSREQEHTQKASGANGGGDSAVDLVAYVEFQRNHRLVVRAHREALIAMRSFWGLLLRNRVDFNQLSRALYRIEVTVKATERAYRGVLVRHGSSARLVRLYGKFLESIKFDPWAASKWYSEADRLEEEAENTKQALQLGGDTMLPGVPGVYDDGGGADRRGIMDLDGVAIICVNAQSVIQAASPEAHALLGYTKNELKGKDLGLIMPAPFGDRHAIYVRKYIQTGVAWVLDRHQEVVVLTKTKQVLPVTLHVTKVSGLNEDSVFLGVIERVPARPNEARAWVLGNGTIIAADELFCDWLGYELPDVVGTAVEEAVVDKAMMGTSVPRPARLAFAFPQELSNPQSVHPVSRGAPPRHSCRSGLAVSLTAYSEQLGPITKPFRLSMQPRLVGGGSGGAKVHIVAMEEVSMEEALAERRLRLTLDLRGTITDTDETAPVGLFGVCPVDLRGKSIAQFIDLFKPQALEDLLASTQHAPAEPFGARLEPAPPVGVHGQDVGKGYDPLTDAFGGAPAGGFTTNGATAPLAHVHITRALMELAKRSSESPNCSWRVGVMAPPDADARQELDHLAHVLGPEVAQTAAELIGFKVIPAIMRVRLVRKLPPAWDASQMAKVAKVAGQDRTDTSGEPSDANYRALSSGSSVLHPTTTGVLVRGAQGLHGGSPGPVGEAVDAADGLSLGEPGGAGDANETSQPPAAEATPVRSPATNLQVQRSQLPPPHQQAASGLLPGGVSRIARASSSPLQQQCQQPSRLQSVTVASDDSHAQMPMAGVMPASPAAMATGLLCLEVELWRADLLSGVLEVDENGKVLRADATCSLGQSGLILGMSPSMLLGSSVADLLPLPLGGVEVLFEHSRPTAGIAGGTFDDKTALVARGGLKQRKSTKRKVGEPIVLTARHQGDGCAVELWVQAVRRAGPAGSAYLVLHPARPAAVQPGFVRWLFGGDTSDLMVQSISQMRTTMLQGIRPIGRNNSMAASGLPSRQQAVQPNLAKDAEFAADSVASANLHPSVLMSTSLSEQAKLQPHVNGDPDYSAYDTGFSLVTDSNLVAMEDPKQAVSKNPQKGKAAADGIHSMVSTWRTSNDILPKAAAGNDGSEGKEDNESDSSSTSNENSQKNNDSDNNDAGGEEKRELEGTAKQRGTRRVTVAIKGADDGAAGTDLEMESEAGAHVANYGVGKRFKKLQRILSSPPQDAVMDLNSVAMASRRVHEIAINGRLLATLYGGNSYVEGLTQFGDPLEDAIAGVYSDLERLMAELKVRGVPYICSCLAELHHGVYLGFRGLRRIPANFGLRAIWDNPLINITLFYDENDLAHPGHIMPQASEGLPSSSRMMGLWDAGNLYLAKSLDLYNNGDSIVAKGINFTAWSTWRFIRTNGPPVIFPAYLATLDALVRLTVQESGNIYQLQLIILCLEGGLLCVAASFYMWIMSAKFAHWRHSLYSVFLQIPIGITRGLANMSLQLEGAEEDEDNGVVAADADVAVQTVDGDAKTMDKKGVRMDVSMGKADGQKRTTGMPYMFGLKGLEDNGSGEPGNGAPDTTAGGSSSGRTGGGIFNALAFWRGRGKVLPRHLEGKTKRYLVPSHILSYALVAPFILWGIAIIAVNLVGYRSLQGMSAPIAALNVVNETLVRFHRMVNYTLEVAGALSVAACSYFKGLLAYELAMWRMDVSVMLYGKEVLQQYKQDGGIESTTADLDQHYSLATAGILFGSSSRPANLLYYTDSCIAEFPIGCQPEDSKYYQITRNGLDVLLKAQFGSIESLLRQADNVSGLNSTEFNMFWATGQSDMEGGLSMMSALFHGDVQNAYSKVKVQQIAIFAIMWVMLAVFSLVALRPFVPFAKNEMRRIAELLSQLPEEANAEGLVMRVIIAAGGTKAAAVKPVVKAAGTAGMLSESNATSRHRPSGAASMKPAASGGGSIKGV